MQTNNVMQKHVFISYSRQNKSFVNKLVRDFEKAGISVWLDATNLTSGTPDWERAIRAAISDAKALVLVATPDSAASAYVQGEITVARARQVPIYAIWAEGVEWIESIRIEMVNHQYIDCRGDDYANGVQVLIRQLLQQKNIAQSTLPFSAELHHLIAHHIFVSIPSNDLLMINTETHSVMESLLDHLYVFFLHAWFDAYSYGKNWLLINHHSGRIAVPHIWLAMPDASLTVVNPQWRRASLKTYGFVPGSYWRVAHSHEVNAVGVATSDTNLFEALTSNTASTEITRLYAAKRFRLRRPIDFTRDEYQFFITLAVNIPGCAGLILVDAQS